MMNGSLAGVYEVPARCREASRLQTLEDYNATYKQSVDNPEKYWGEVFILFCVPC